MVGAVHGYCDRAADQIRVIPFLNGPQPAGYSTVGHIELISKLMPRLGRDPAYPPPNVSPIHLLALSASDICFENLQVESDMGNLRRQTGTAPTDRLGRLSGLSAAQGV
jgi:hypothetical protein